MTDHFLLYEISVNIRTLWIDGVSYVARQSSIEGIGVSGAIVMNIQPHARLGDTRRAEIGG